MQSVVLATTIQAKSGREIRNAALARTAAGEGIVLLKNDGVLPVNREKKVALYGSGARRTVSGGTGSGATHPRETVSIEAGLLAAGYDIVTRDVLDKFDAFYEAQYAAWKADIEERVKDIRNPMQALGVAIANKFMYPTGIPLDEEDIRADKADIAVYVLARQAGEGNDRFDKKGDFQVDDLEYGNLKILSERYRKLVLVINVGGLIDLSFTDEIRTDAILFFGQGGMEGGGAFADVFSGEVNPSGKLACTWANKLSDYPTTAAFSRAGNPREQNYTEGIFVGYRYFDSFEVPVRYPFGYGLSYTTFSIRTGAVRQKGETIYTEVTVTNTGTCAGKEVVQLYVSVPRRASCAEYQRLVAFRKTNLLAPGQSQTMVIDFPFTDCACYYREIAAYILNSGYYMLRVGNSSRNTEAVMALFLAGAVVSEECENICPPRTKIAEITPGVPENIGPMETKTAKAMLVRPRALHKGKHTYTEPGKTGDPWIEGKLHAMSDEELITLIVGGGLHTKMHTTVMGSSGNTTASLYDKYGITNLVCCDGPAGLNVTPRIVQLPNGDVKSVEVYPQYDFGCFGAFMRRSLGKEGDGTMHYQYATTWPAEIVQAQTWNEELLEEIGRAVGAEMMEFGVTVWEAPGINLYRNPLGGRVFEYYSEDPCVAGTMAGALSRGVQSYPGICVCLKHFACNNSEVDRDLSSSNISERALREVYLKGFEIALRKGHARTVMASYNKVNGLYVTNNSDLLVKVLRCEWGFDGLVMSDWNAVDVDRGDPCLAVLAQCDLIMPGKDVWRDMLKEGLEKGVYTREDLERSASRVLRLVKENPFEKVS